MLVFFGRYGAERELDLLAFLTRYEAERELGLPVFLVRYGPEHELDLLVVQAMPAKPGVQAQGHAGNGRQGFENQAKNQPISLELLTTPGR